MIKTAKESKENTKKLIAAQRKHASDLEKKRKQEAADHPALKKPVYK